MTHVGTLIVGAGPTGFGAVWELERQGDRDYLLVDERPVPGGQAGSHSQDGYTFDYGGHVIHSHFPDFDAAIAAAGIVMQPVLRNGSVWMDNDFVPTPVQQQLARMPEDLRPGAPARDLGEYFRNEMGGALYQTFFEPFNTKMWAHPLSEMAHEWTSLRNGSSESNVPQVGLRGRAVQRPDEYFPYPELGTGSIWKAIAGLFDPQRQLHCRTLRHIDLADHRARFTGMSDITYDRLITTAPLDGVWQMVGRPGPPIVHTQAILLGYGFEGTPPATLRDKGYIYCPDRDVVWHRATMLSNYSPRLAPDGCWSILFEVGRSEYRPVSVPEAVTGARRSLDALGVDMDSVRTSWIKDLSYGYPVPTLDRDLVIAGMHALLTEHDVLSRGRFGGWRYESCNQDYSFAQGVEAVNGGDSVLWAPEKY